MLSPLVIQFAAAFTFAALTPSAGEPPVDTGAPVALGTGVTGTLTLNRLHVETLGPSSNVTYRVQLAEAGVVNLLLDGTGDLVLRIRDERGTLIGESDDDIDGQLGREAVAIRISTPGTYRVEIEEISGTTSTYSLMASLTPFAPFQESLRPERTVSVDSQRVGVVTTRTLTASQIDDGDLLVFTPERDGLLLLFTESVTDAPLDLLLEQYNDGSFCEDALRRADDDLGGDTAREAMTIAVRAGQPVYVRVVILEGETGARYRVSSELR